MRPAGRILRHLRKGTPYYVKKTLQECEGTDDGRERERGGECESKIDEATSSINNMAGSAGTTSGAGDVAVAVAVAGALLLKYLVYNIYYFCSST